MSDLPVWRRSQGPITQGLDGLTRWSGDVQRDLGDLERVVDAHRDALDVIDARDTSRHRITIQSGAVTSVRSTGRTIQARINNVGLLVIELPTEGQWGFQAQSPDTTQRVVLFAADIAERTLVLAARTNADIPQSLQTGSYTFDIAITNYAQYTNQIQ